MIVRYIYIDKASYAPKYPFSTIAGLPYHQTENPYSQRDPCTPRSPNSVVYGVLRSYVRYRFQLRRPAASKRAQVLCSYCLITSAKYSLTSSLLLATLRRASGGQLPLFAASPPFIRVMVEQATPKVTPRPGHLVSRNGRGVVRDAMPPPRNSSAQRKARISRSALSCLPSRSRRARPWVTARRR